VPIPWRKRRAILPKNTAKAVADFSGFSPCWRVAFSRNRNKSTKAGIVEFSSIPNSGWTGKSLGNCLNERFLDFIALDADRYGILLEQINKLNVDSAVVPVAGNNHIFIFPPGQKSKKSSGFPFSGQSPAILAAHYDRVDGSPGANDNSAAVFLLLKAAQILAQRGLDRWMIVFTDKEELVSGEGIAAQGSFSLAEKLISWGLENARIFNFDACGSGDTFVFSNTTDHIMKNDARPGVIKAMQIIRQLRDHAMETARSLHLDKVLLAPIPFSDDAGFLRAGLPALTITMLPSKEASGYSSLLRNRPDFASTLISGGIKNPAERLLIPETWRSLNSASDTHLRLTPQFYGNVIRFAVELCR